LEPLRSASAAWAERVKGCFAFDFRPVRREVEAPGHVIREFGIFGTTPFRVSDQAIDHESPVDVRHSACGRALSETQQGALDLAGGRLAICGAIEPMNEGVVSFEVRLHKDEH
jgi:hypothetical protein